MCLANDILFEDEEEDEDEEDSVVYVVYDIDWDTDDDDVELPNVMRMAVMDEDELADAMSDITGYCVKRFECKLEEEYEA